MSDSGTVTGETSPVRKIIHIDMDAFYASVEQRDAQSFQRTGA